jgi:hypothetical protein
VSLIFNYGDRSLPVQLGGSVKEKASNRVLTVVGGSEGADFGLSVTTKLGTKDWVARSNWDGTHPLSLWNELLPVDHRYSLAAMLSPWVEEWDVASLHLEALGEGVGAELERLSLLAEQGPSRARFSHGIEVLSNAIAAGLSWDGGVVEQAELVLDLEYVSFLGGQTRPLKASVTRAEGKPVRLELPSVRWTRPGELEVEAALRAFWSPEAETGEVQLSVQHGAYGEWAIKPFRWFANWSPEGLSSRASRLSLDAYPDWQLANTHFEKSAQGALSFSTDLEFVPRQGQMLTLFGLLEDVGESYYTGQLKVVGASDELLGELQGSSDPDGIRFDGAGRWNIQNLIPYVLAFSPELRGLKGSGEVNWNVGGRPHTFFLFQSEVEVGLSGISLTAPDRSWMLKGIESEMTFRSVGTFPASKGTQELRIDRIESSGEAVEDVVLRFDWPTRDQIRILSFEGNWMGGRVSFEPFEINLKAPAINTVLHFDGVEAAQLLEDAEQIGFSLDARLRGSLALSYDFGGKLSISKGLLRLISDQDARAVVHDSLRLTQLLGLPDIANIRTRVSKAIESDFRIQSLDITLFDTGHPEQPIRAAIKGSILNADVQIPEFEIVQAHQMATGLEGWQRLLFLLSGGKLSP